MSQSSEFNEIEREFSYEAQAEICLFRAQEILEDTALCVEERAILSAEWREMSDAWAARLADQYETSYQDDEAEDQTEALKAERERLGG